MGAAWERHALCESALSVKIVDTHGKDRLKGLRTGHAKKKAPQLVMSWTHVICNLHVHLKHWHYFGRSTASKRRCRSRPWKRIRCPNHQFLPRISKLLIARDEVSSSHDIITQNSNIMCTRTRTDRDIWGFQPVLLTWPDPKTCSAARRICI